MKLIDLANSIYYNDLLESSDTSVTKILYWLASDNNIGTLNDFIATEYVIVGNEAVPELSNEAAGIYGIYYLLKYYERMAKTSLNASALDVIEVKEADTTVRLVNRNEIAKTYKGFANDTRDYLNKLVESYKKFHCIPASIHSNFFAEITKIIQQP